MALQMAHDAAQAHDLETNLEEANRSRGTLEQKLGVTERELEEARGAALRNAGSAEENEILSGQLEAFVEQIKVMAKDRDVLKQRLSEAGILRAPTSPMPQSRPPLETELSGGDEGFLSLVRSTQGQMEQLKAMQQDMEAIDWEKAQGERENERAATELVRQESHALGVQLEHVSSNTLHLIDNIVNILNSVVIIEYDYAYFDCYHTSKILL